MKVQRVQLPDSQSVTWLVLDDAYLPIEPIRQFLVYLENLERSPHTIRAYAGHLKRYWDYLHATRLDWTLVGIGELANFVAWLRQPQPRLLALHEQVAPRTVSTINAILTAVTMFYDYHQRAGTGPAIPLYRDHLRPYRRYKSYLHHLTKGKPIRTRLIKLKPPRHHPKTLTEEQVNMLVAACQRKRDKFLLKLLYETGMRIWVTNTYRTRLALA
jgi:integrase/recombinase XerD